MKLIHKDIKKGEVKIKIDSLDDLWYLSHIIIERDLVSGKSERKIKVGQEPNLKVVRKAFFLSIDVEKVEFSKHSDTLRVSGKVQEGPEEVSRGSYHTFNLEDGTEFTLKKEKFLQYQIDKLNEASSEKGSKIMLVVLDREEAYLALMKKYGYEILAHLSGKVQKKAMEQQSSNFYKDLYTAIKEYDERHKFNNIIVASPAFFKEDFMKEASGLKEKITLATCSSVGENALNEVLKRDEVKAVLQQDRIAKEMRFVDEVMSEISKDGKAAYGFDETENAANSGAAEMLLVSDKLILSYRRDEIFDKLDNIMKIIDNSKGKVHIISSEHDGGKQLDGLGGIAALLRYKLS